MSEFVSTSHNFKRKLEWLTELRDKKSRPEFKNDLPSSGLGWSIDINRPGVHPGYLENTTSTRRGAKALFRICKLGVGLLSETLAQLQNKSRISKTSWIGWRSLLPSIQISDLKVGAIDFWD